MEFKPIKRDIIWDLDIYLSYQFKENEKKWLNN